MFFSRLDAQYKNELFQQRNKNEVWRADEGNFGDTKDILANLIVQEDGNYCFPKGFSFDINYNQQVFFSEASKKS